MRSVTLSLTSCLLPYRAATSDSLGKCSGRSQGSAGAFTLFQLRYPNVELSQPSLTPVIQAGESAVTWAHFACFAVLEIASRLHASSGRLHR
jgi:hypothetical protein